MVNWHDHISTNPDIMLGKACFKGTRIPVYLVLRKMAMGETEQDILESYPKLSHESVQAAMFFAVDAVNNEVVYPVPN